MKPDNDTCSAPALAAQAWQLPRILAITVIALVAFTSASLFSGTARASSLPPPKTPASPAASVTPGCTDGTQASGALYRVCFPATWNGYLIVYAHGSISPDSPLQISDPVVIPGPPPVTLSQIFLNGHFAFATSSFSKNGLAILEGVDDLADLVQIFETDFATPSRVFMAGFSEGGLITALSVERHPDLYNGGIAGCGAVGSYQALVDYSGDIRVVFDYFFPNLIPGNGYAIPSSLIDKWDDKYAPAIKQTLLDNPDKLHQLMAVTHIPVQTSGDDAAQADVVLSLLKGAAGVDESIAELGGKPYDNRTRVYSGSADDADLNHKVKRYKADESALVELQKYETSGVLTRPLVTMHTTRDWLVPFSQEALYTVKTGSNPLHINLVVDRDGHCTFTATDLNQALTALLVAAQ